jgi:hypothetical protein
MRPHEVTTRLLRRMVLRLLPLFLTALFLGFQARPAQAAPSAATCTWTGISSQLWSNYLNWVCTGPVNRVPIAGDSVTIPNGSSTGPSVDVAVITINDLEVDSGKQVILGTNVTFNLYHLSVYGEINLNGHSLTLNNNTSIMVGGSGSKIDGLGTMLLTCNNSSYCSPSVSIINNGIISAYTEIDPNMTVTALTSGGGQWGQGTITVDSFSTLQVADGYFLQISGDIENYGTVTGHGAINFSGENFDNNGSFSSVSVDALQFAGGFAIYLSGTGTWTSDTVEIIDGTGVYLNNSMTWSINSLRMYSGAALGLGSYDLTFDSNVSIEVNNTNTWVYGTGTLTLKKTATLAIDTGKITSPLTVDPSGTGTPATVTASSTNGGSVKQLTVANGATLNIDNGYSLLVTGPLNVASGGVVSGGGTLDGQGASLTNNGNISVAHLELDYSAMSISGAGGWASNLIEVTANNQATLANDMVWAAPGVTIGTAATLDLGAQNLTLSGPGTITINFNSTQSAINGTGTLKFQTNITLNLYDAAIGAPCVIDSGTTSVQANYGEFMKDVTVSNGAALAVLGGSSLIVSGNVQVAQGGTVSGDGSSLHFWGGTFNSDGLVSIGAVWFQGTNPVLTGNGTFDPTQLTVVPATSLTIQNSPIVYAIWVESGGSLILAGANLTLTGPGLALDAQGAFTPDAGSTVIYKGSQPQQINASSFSRLTIDNPTGVSLTKDLAVTTNLNLIQGVLDINTKLLNLKSGWQKTGGSLQSAASGTVVYSRITSAQSIMPAQYGNLTVSGGSKTLNLAGASVNGQLALNADIQTSGAAVKLVLSRTATSTGNGDVIGTVERVGPFTLNHVYSFGNPGTAITFTVGAALPTSIDVKLVKSAPTGLNNALARTYTITKVGTSTFTANLRLHYLPAELHGLASNTLCIWRQDLSVWTALPVSSSNPVSAWLETRGVTSLTVFGLANKTGYQIFLPFVKR